MATSSDEGEYFSPEKAVSAPTKIPRTFPKILTKDFEAKSGVEVRMKSLITAMQMLESFHFRGPCLLTYFFDSDTHKFKSSSQFQIGNGLYLGRPLGAGVQAKVFDVVHKDGTATGKVMKLAHSDLGRKVFLDTMAASMMNMQFEWELGLILKGAMEAPDGTLPGFTATLDCVALIQDEKKGTATFQGLSMERMNGWPISKRVMDPSFHNIHYVREMLFQVLSALDRAQRALGFNHADMGLGNVMEHYPEVYPHIEKANIEANLKAMGQPVPTEDASEAAAAGYISSSDGGLHPLGSQVEFKIIDYGIGEFNDVLAQAAGGRTPEETFQYMQQVIARRLKAAVPGAEEGVNNTNRTYDLVAADGSSADHGKLKGWKLVPVGKPEDNQYLSQPNLDMLHSTSALREAFPQKGRVEKLYRNFWERKGDVFHLMLALGMALDDRVWPKEDEKDVQLFASLVHHVTGIKIRAYFVTGEEENRIKIMGKTHRGKKGRKQEREEVDESYYGRRARLFTKLRRLRLMYSAHRKPFNSGLLAGEALMSPFFRTKGPTHAAPRVSVEKLFPEEPAEKAT